MDLLAEEPEVLAAQVSRCVRLILIWVAFGWKGIKAGHLIQRVNGMTGVDWASSLPSWPMACCWRDSTSPCFVPMSDLTASAQLQAPEELASLSEEPNCFSTAAGSRRAGKFVRGA